MNPDAAPVTEVVALPPQLQQLTVRGATPALLRGVQVGTQVFRKKCKFWINLHQIFLSFLRNFPEETFL